MNEQNRPPLPQGAPLAGNAPEPAQPAPEPAAQKTAASGGSSWAWSEPEDAGPQGLGSQGWGNKQAGQPKSGLPGGWTMKRTLIVAGVAVVVAAGTAAGFYALGGAGSADAANVPLGQGGTSGLGGQQEQVVPGQGGLGQAAPGQMGGNMGPDGLGMAGGLNGAIHSEYVVLREEDYVTMADQQGTVSEVTTNSLTVKSEDGFTRTYVLSDDTTVAQGTRQRGSATSTLTLSDVTVGSTVRVTASKDGNSYSAASIRLAASGQGATSGQGTGSGQGSTSGLGTSS
ncbi:hypothetical protein [Arthrobacter sp. 18067]|uniref:hypothetical protein n=1 Tax=Arthrobacter sp. 18067 TaxID=2681413 RepID=UPI001358AA9D|nr:hypothetical protein [Arthrobacter sp. 18067]